MNIRTLVVKKLSAVIQERRSLTALLAEGAGQLGPPDEALLQMLCYGVCRWHLRLEMICQQLLSKPLKSKDSDIQLLLQLGIYQLLYTRIPAHAALHETVNACAELGKPWARGLVNAILRRLQREQQAVLTSLQEQPAYQYSHPAWLLSELQQAWPDDWEAICNANNTQAPLTLRVNRHHASRSDYLTLLAAVALDATPCRWSPDGLQLETPCATGQLPQFSQGAVSVQDEAAQLAAALLQTRPGQRVLDACAAPGGKSCHLVESEPALQELLALDLHPERLQKVEENLRRLQLKASLVAGDAANPPAWWDKQPFDRILLDAPCSATGVIRRHPDIKLLRRQADIDKLAAHQLKLLNALWPLLKPGGLLLYATCSILPQENEAVIAKFLSTAPDAQEVQLEVPWGKAGRHGRYLLPTPGGSDGFYYAKLRKPPSNGCFTEYCNDNNNVSQ